MNTSLSLWRSRLTRISHALLKACASVGSRFGSKGEFNVPSSFPSAPLHFKLVRNAGEIFSNAIALGVACGWISCCGVGCGEVAETVGCSITDGSHSFDWRQGYNPQTIYEVKNHQRNKAHNDCLDREGENSLDIHN